MKGIFSIATYLALVSALASAAPLARRWTVISPDYFEVIEQASPYLSIGSTQSPTISVINGNNEVDSFVSFSPIAGATSTSTCQFVLRGVSATPNAAIQLFSLVSPLTGAETFNSHPSVNQDEGQASIDPYGNSAPLYGTYVPCTEPLQFIIRPHFTDGTIQWTQGPTVGAFIEYTP